MTADPIHQRIAAWLQDEARNVHRSGCSRRRETGSDRHISAVPGGRRGGQRHERTRPRLALAAAAVVVVALAGLSFLPRDGDGIAGPRPTRRRPHTCIHPDPDADRPPEAADVNRALACRDLCRRRAPFAAPFSVSFGARRLDPVRIGGPVRVHFRHLMFPMRPEPYVAVECSSTASIGSLGCHTEVGSGPVRLKPLTVDAVGTPDDRHMAGFDAGPVTETEVDGRPAKDVHDDQRDRYLSTAGCTGGGDAPADPSRSASLATWATNGQHRRQTWWVFDGRRQDDTRGSTGEGTHHEPRPERPRP